MTRAGSSDVELLAYAQAHRRELPSEVSEQDLNYLRDSGVSERVVSYMSAVDARIPDDTQYDSVPVSPDQAVPPNGSYPHAYPQDEGGVYGNAYSNGDVGGYPDSYAYAYPYAYDGQCGSQWGYDCYPYFNSYYPYYPYYYYPYTFFGSSPFFPFHGHGHHFHGHDGSNGHNGSNGNQWRGQSGGTTTTGRVASNDAWRQRGVGSVNSSTRMPAALGQRGPSRTVVARPGMGTRPGTAGRAFANRSFGPSGPGRAFSGGSRMPAASLGSRGSVARPSFSGGMRGSGGAGHSGFSGGGMRASGGGMHGGGGARGGGGRH